MIFLSQTDLNQEKTRHVVLFGTGLIGGAIFDTLVTNGFAKQMQVSLQWLTPEYIAHQIRTALLGIHLTGSEIHWIWAAGKAGFSADEHQCASELATYRTILETIAELRSNQPDITHFFHQFSSAGGLFEGERDVYRDTLPTPKRPYGALKLAQETLSHSCWNAENLFIYRPSSVYGYIRAGQRSGLITTLLRNTMCSRTTLLTGKLSTLRDYVWAEDIARFVLKNIMQPIVSGHLLLATGRPVSIHAVRHIVQNITHRPSYLKVASAGDNTANNTFRGSALPGGWMPTSVEINIRKILSDAISRGSIFS